jgi:hypothetical protein
MGLDFFKEVNGFVEKREAHTTKQKQEEGHHG